MGVGLHDVFPPKLQEWLPCPKHQKMWVGKTSSESAVSGMPTYGITSTHAPPSTSSNKPKHAPSGSRVTILTLEMLHDLVKDPQFKIQRTEDKTMDRSKGDAFSKAILLLQ